MSGKRFYRDHLKRLLDVVLALAALVVLSPILLVTALLVRIKLGSPVVFRQARPGMHEKVFYLYKFRSMTNEKGPDGKLLPDAQRLTRFGRFLRSSSLDELLELVNIIKGDMSIVGPRPLSVYYLPHYPESLRRRHAVRPGLTGLAQVNGRNNLPWDERFALDIRYVDELSFGLDVKIVFETAFKVLKRADVSVRGTTKVKDYGPYTVLKEESGEGQKMADMTYSEIGSYFWLEDTDAGAQTGDCSWLPAAADSCFTFSGRNAIDVALRDAGRRRTIKKAYAPSYCCVSMLQSFFDRGIQVEFYSVGYEDGRFTYRLPAAGEGDLVLIMSYFGLDAASAHEAIRALHDKGALVIEDVTHSLLRPEPASPLSDYLVASLRKWFAVPAGGWVGKREGAIAEKPSMDSNQAVKDKIAAMREKYDYLTGKITDKEDFLLANAKFDNDLIHVDRMLRIDDTSRRILESTDVERIREKRRENAAVLLDALQELNGRGLSLPAVDRETDVPLFLPIFMETARRDSLRKYLIDRGIYCPVHWPEVMGAPAGVRENELSLICDQRYSTGDMAAVADSIRRWFAANG